MSPQNTTGSVAVAQPQRCGSSESSSWEEAYLRFETSEEEIAKFTRRLRWAGCESWPKDAAIIELFCGRGNGLHALTRLGFSNVEGADLSASLVARYCGSAKCYVCDCRALPFETASRDVVLIHGGLHHLTQLPRDLEQTLSEVRRVLKPGGVFFLVEPWLTPFLRVVHLACNIRLLRRISIRLDSLATMIDHERDTYEQWLSDPEIILSLLRASSAENKVRIRLGKIYFLGR
jgi:SAM-dependent methyltransferase